MNSDQLKQQRQEHAKNLVKIWKQRFDWFNNNRELLIFTHGEEWFYEQRKKIDLFPSEDDLKLPE